MSELDAIFSGLEPQSEAQGARKSDTQQHAASARKRARSEKSADASAREGKSSGGGHVKAKKQKHADASGHGSMGRQGSEERSALSVGGTPQATVADDAAVRGKPSKAKKAKLRDDVPVITHAPESKRQTPPKKPTNDEDVSFADSRGGNSRMSTNACLANF